MKIYTIMHISDQYICSSNMFLLEVVAIYYLIIIQFNFKRFSQGGSGTTAGQNTKIRISHKMTHYA
jgi:hypothetical protein